MIKLGLNIDHVATLRQVRGSRYPNVVRAALICEEAGVDAITLICAKIAATFRMPMWQRCAECCKRA
jgi:hypothetical protein